jgi:hypothetical protein
VAVGDHLRGLVDDRHHLVDAERLFLRDGRDHGVRRGRADGARRAAARRSARSSASASSSSTDVARGLRIGEEELRGARRTEEAPEQRLQRRGRRGARASAAALAGLGEHVDEERRLAVLGRALAPGSDTST